MQTPFPERTFNLPNDNLQLCHVHFIMEARVDFFWRSHFKEQLQRFFQVCPGFTYRVTLTSDINFWTEGHIAIIFLFNDGG